MATQARDIKGNARVGPGQIETFDPRFFLGGFYCAVLGVLAAWKGAESSKLFYTCLSLGASPLAKES